MNTVISFSCPAYLAMQLNEQNIPSRKKSEWIAEAIKEKLEPKEVPLVNDWDTKSQRGKIITICHDEDVPILVRREAKVFNQWCGIECKSCPYAKA